MIGLVVYLLASCQDTKSGPVCGCEKCTQGDYCDQPIKSCECNSLCTPGESCRLDSNYLPQCFCEDKCYFGPGCAQRKNTCECYNPCSSDQVCSEVNGQLTCDCLDPCANLAPSVSILYKHVSA
ncbi:hypothetical protein EB796_015870 [Bugula neritina]|uniref:Uncharacterized protein n=1 Tax=Bugula neritina TaxID=10212 RepID=A0A7J7JI84_BUGNE|nr:hypothetical protein EB796_015870 [Bugula neritina]